MKYLELLRAQRAGIDEKRTALTTELETIATLAIDEKRSFEPTEEARVEEIRSELAAVETEITPLDAKIAEFEAIAERSKNIADKPELQIIKPVEIDLSVDVRYMRPQEARDMAMKILEADKVGSEHLRSDQVDKLDALIRKADKNTDGADVARRLIATESPEYRSGWQKLVTQPQPILTADEARAVERFNEYRAASLTDADGGYGVPVMIDPSIITTAQGSLNPFRKISRVESITTKAWKGVSSAGVSWSFDPEAGAVSDDSATLAQPVVTAHQARGFIPFSIQIGSDYPGFAVEMAKLLAEGYDELQALKFVSGTGSDEPYGIIVALDANTNVEVVVTTDGAFGGVDINKVWGALPDRWKQNATWMMNHDTGNEVDSFGASNNLSFFTVALGGVGKVLKERPVAFASHFPDFSGTTGASNILVVGDFQNFLIAERVGMDVELVPHLFDVTDNRPTGQRGWFAHARIGSDSINDAAFRLLQNQ